MDQEKLQQLCRLLRYDIVTSTTQAGSGHPSSSLSAVELMGTLFFAGYLRYDLKNPRNISNDRVIFSKGHASPLLYSLYHAVGAISEKELMSLREFNSPLEGHPTPRFKYVDVATGSLGQGLSAGIGIALGIKKHVGRDAVISKSRTDPHLKGVMNRLETAGEIKNPSLDRLPIVWVLLGDSEMSEGQNWEAIQLAAFYRLNNLVAIIDINRLGQSRETMIGWKLQTYEKRLRAFGWNTIIVGDGHDTDQVKTAYEKAIRDSENLSVPTVIIAKTIKGKGVSYFENKEGVHGRALPKDKLDESLKELGDVDTNVRGALIEPPHIVSSIEEKPNPSLPPIYQLDQLVSTREAYGESLCLLGEKDAKVLVLDAEVSNSTYSDKFKQKFFDRFYEMFIAEQNMVSTAVGLSKMGFVPFVSTFASFMSRAFDQIRMAQYSGANLKLMGSHAGVSIGNDGPSQMGLEDMSMMRSISESVVFYPSDAIATMKLLELMHKHQGISYLRATRQATPVIYKDNESFKIGGSKIIHQSFTDRVVVFAAGITLHESIKAFHELQREKINIAVVDLYSIKPLDEKTINELAKRIKYVIVVEDHYAFGGLGEAVKMALKNTDISFTHLAVRKTPLSGKSEELLAYEEIDAQAIMKAVKK